MFDCCGRRDFLPAPRLRRIAGNFPKSGELSLGESEATGGWVIVGLGLGSWELSVGATAIDESVESEG